ncbi:TIGR01777 family oxidoreductase [Sciscionella sediminilitoris]|uniref:TIGR01777 family oxidoreductase n=1 Tax=Sciscionella sediminilitoris TaxID=1445613 RepID=UPI0004DF2586|nr:TIGR01777 family oxidoreductase [Sciscionella sp. SE31]
MGLRYDSVLEAPIGDVFDWHARSGAITRLMPPWQPVRVLEETTSLRNGRTVLGFPGGLRWHARHQADGYDPPHRFVDRLANPPLATALTWRHTHEFIAETATTTRMRDTIESAVPAAVLRSMFAYRHRQLAAELAAQSRARAWHPTPLTVAVTGSGGLVGSALCALLSTGGHRVIRLVRRRPRSAGERAWHPHSPAPGLLAGVDAVIHLAGVSIAGRFTEAHLRAVRESRVGPTRRLAECAANTPQGPDVFVSASAIGYYGPDGGDERLSETSERGSGVLADLVADWEAAAIPAAEAGMRTVQVRTGIVQTPRGGTLGLLYPLFAVGLGGRLGSGEQWLSWIGLDDLLDIYRRAVLDDTLSGPVNAVAPNPVRNTDYTSTLGRVLHRPALLPIPAFGPRLLLGSRGADELALADQRVEPAILARAGHQFRRPHLETELGHLLGRAGAASRPR